MCFLSHRKIHQPKHFPTSPLLLPLTPLQPSASGKLDMAPSKLTASFQRKSDKAEHITTPTQRKFLLYTTRELYLTSLLVVVKLEWDRERRLCDAVAFGSGHYWVKNWMASRPSRRAGLRSRLRSSGATRFDFLSSGMLLPARRGAASREPAVMLRTSAEPVDTRREPFHRRQKKSLRDNLSRKLMSPAIRRRVEKPGCETKTIPL